MPPSLSAKGEPMRIGKMIRLAIVATGVAILAGAASADIRMPAVFSDNMVLQSGMAVPVWGWADKGEKVTVKFAGQEKTATADDTRKWMLRLDVLRVSDQPTEMTVAAGTMAVTIRNVLVGEVWLGSGQSNMEMSVGGVLNVDKVVAEAKYPLIRMFTVERKPCGEPRDDVFGRWVVCAPETVRGFSAAAYFFGRRIHKELGVPVGLVHSSWGGTAIEPWTPRCGFEMVPSLLNYVRIIDDAPASYRKQVSDAIAKVEAWVPKAKEAVANNAPIPPAPQMPQHPLDSAGGVSGLYNGMIHGLIPYAIKGALWYQGESNGGEGRSYYDKMVALIGGWRRLWGEGDFPFYFVRLASFMAPNDNPEGGDGWARVEEAQAACLSIPNTGMACLTDIGDARDIHPKNKQDVGERLALWALARDYGKKDLVYSGPMFKAAKIDGPKVVITFDYVGSGLMVGKKEGLAPTQEVRDGTLKGFAIKGDDGKWYWADAKIEAPKVDADARKPRTKEDLAEDLAELAIRRLLKKPAKPGPDTSLEATWRVVVSSDKVAKPVAVRYGFTTNTDHINLYNKEGLPAVPFRTDKEWEPK
jgi:sialate O-acetylesterase